MITAYNIATASQIANGLLLIPILICVNSLKIATLRITPIIAKIALLLMLDVYPLKMGAN